MCGRFAIFYSKIDLKNLYNISGSISIEPNYNVTPLSDIPVIVRDIENEEDHVENMRWGLIPSWSKDESIGNKLINARAETITEKHSFKKSFQSKRCIIPVSGFYEWHTQTRQPYFIKPKEQIFSFAGIWDEWKSPLDGNTVKTCAIITTEPNEVLKDIHNRMPVVLKQKDLKTWLNPKSSTDSLKELLKPYDDEMDCFEVSKRVNSPINNDLSLIEYSK